ncbi:MAG: hypothetical protein GTO45_35895 [Candidatus Aminicenantes bacterium]|nr:hypothetical protein [Candidatus Aminicenantes bacterium]NIN23535.1 hypothetical protein [Candidatus Aminicenantes bacterium]NIN47240.1 hypothetical protein [Candidatus Aminicenantes bacterium]NIN90167.1 hypothetical protein [Candidatus Aminicenantes bacterium]NIR11114.1 hypothetical protein [Candidatus Aminicenantes bacterium]
MRREPITYRGALVHTTTLPTMVMMAMTSLSATKTKASSLITLVRLPIN